MCAATVIAVIAVGCGGGSKSSATRVHATYTVHGGISAGNADYPNQVATDLLASSTNSADCSKGFPSSSVGAKTGTPVVVHDESGKTLATTALGSGSMKWVDNDGFVCTFPFDVDLPSATFYRFAIGAEKEIEVPASDAKDGSIELTVHV